MKLNYVSERDFSETEFDYPDFQYKVAKKISELDGVIEHIFADETGKKLLLVCLDASVVKREDPTEAGKYRITIEPLYPDNNNYNKDTLDADTDAARSLLGMIGNMISNSKSKYREDNPNNLVIFNANICTDTHKIWFGDIDITKSRYELKKLASLLNKNIYVLYENDGRFQNEETPLISKYVVKINPNKEITLGSSIDKLYDTKYLIKQNGSI